MADKPFFVRPVPLGTVTTGNERAARPATHLGEFLFRGMRWQSDGNSNLWLKCDLGAARDIDFVAVMAANALPDTTIRIRLDDDESGVSSGSADYDSTALPFIDPAITRADGRYHSHHELPAVQSRCWLRIDIGGHTGDFSAAMLVIGKRLTPTRYYETRWERAVRDLGGVTFGRNGVPGVSRGARLRAIQFRLAWVTEQEMEELFSPLDEATGKTDPLYLCFDPAATTMRQRRTFFGFNEEQPALMKQGFDRFERSFQFLSLF